MKTLVWFRNDLRVADNPALFEASQRGNVVACFVVSDLQWRDHHVGDRRLAFLGRTLNALIEELARLGIPMEVVTARRFSEVPDVLLELARRLGVGRIAFNAEYPCNETVRDEAVTELMQRHGVEVLQTHGGVTLPPGSVLTKKGTPYSVFTPFKRAWHERLQAGEFQPLPAPRRQADPIPLGIRQDIGGVSVDLDSKRWPAGERVACNLLARFLEKRVDRYHTDRDMPRLPGTSRLSAHLSVGSLSSNQALHAAAQLTDGRLSDPQIEAWVNQIVWREFYRHVAALFPRVSRGQAFRHEAGPIAWRDAPAELSAWQQGMTGYPLVDAGMRQLATEGWMHNRLRMVTAMFLTKHLLIHWRHGERFFMEQLVDGDFAANNGGWQWSASTGTDAAPYFRVFNPTTQGKRFDAAGAFTRALLPELSEVPDRFLFEPHRAGLEIDYPEPMVEHRFARQRALAAFRGASSPGESSCGSSPLRRE